MKTFPMFLKFAGRNVVIIGGGEQAAQKARLVLKTEAEIRLVAPALDPELQDLVSKGRAHLFDRSRPDLFSGSALVFVATGCKGADAAWHAVAKAAGVLVNVVDYPDLCDAMTPSIVDRDPVVVAIGTEGNAPLLGRKIKTRIEEILHPSLGAFAALAGRLRSEVAFRVPSRSRRDFWQWVFSGAPWKAFSSGRERMAAGLIKDAIETGQTETIGSLCIALGATAPGLIPMSVVQRLQEADTIFVDHGVPDTVLELARRDAERIRIAPKDVADRVADTADALVRNAARRQAVVYLREDMVPVAIEDKGSDEIVVEQLACASPVSWTDHRAVATVGASA